MLHCTSNKYCEKMCFICWFEDKYLASKVTNFNDSYQFSLLKSVTFDASILLFSLLGRADIPPPAPDEKN